MLDGMEDVKDFRWGKRNRTSKQVGMEIKNHCGEIHRNSGEGTINISEKIVRQIQVTET
ncbi:hypothetical protein DsansV1_C07g0074881 [Dioscorea sansibarensis]